MNNKQVNLPNLFAESNSLITLVITSSLVAVCVILVENSFGVAAAIFGSIALILAAHILNNAAILLKTLPILSARYWQFTRYFSLLLLKP